MNLLIEIAQYLEQQLKQKLIAQGHVATKALLNSIKVEVKNEVDKWLIVGSNLEYGNAQDKGQPPNTFVPITVLIDWIRIKQINLKGRRELDVAFAIQKRIMAVGTPTNGDPKRKRWLSGTLEEESNTVQQMIQKALQQEVELMMTNIIEQTKQLVNGN